ncbi:MAG: ATP-binding protein [Candidatus Omnitrophica bacterium]|nr:ATP-binding protein [Candidatus Omnitrophota bacterium]
MNTPMVFGREEIRSALVKRIEGFSAGYRQNLALLGPGGAGKSFLIRRILQEEVCRFPLLIAVYLEIREKESATEWTLRFLTSFLYGFLKSDGEGEIPLGDLRGLIERCRGRVPSFAAEARELLEVAQGGYTQELFDRLWDLPHRLTQESGRLVLLVLDEFQGLRALAVKDPLGRLGKKIMMQHNTLFVLISSRPAEAQAILQGRFNLLFGQFEVIPLAPLDPPSALRAIRGHPQGQTLDPFLARLTIELAQGYPEYLDLLLTGFGRAFPPGDPPDPADVIRKTLAELLLRPAGILRGRFEERLKSLPVDVARPFWVEVLAALAGGHHRLGEIHQAAGRGRLAVKRALEVLEEAGLVVRHGVFYRIPDRLFELWLLTAYPVLQGLEWVPEDVSREQFYKALNNRVNQLRENLRKPLEEQIVWLVCQWGNEMAEVEGRRLLLPAFRKVERITRASGQRALWARGDGSGKRDWLIFPVDGPLTEAAALRISQEAKAVAFRKCRKFLLGPYPIELNARLILQGCRIPLWDLPTVHELLSLYGLAGLAFLDETAASSVLTREIAPAVLEASPPGAENEVAG